MHYCSSSPQSTLKSNSTPIHTAHMSAPPGPGLAGPKNSPPPLSKEDEELIATAIGAKIADDKVTFQDGSTWKFEYALSQMVLHQHQSPSVAHQTFAVRCISDPFNAHGKYTEGVMKVDFQ